MPQRERVAVVAGDVTVDWSLAHRPAQGAAGHVWRIENNTRLFVQPGGAALVADLVRAIAGRLDETWVVHSASIPDVPDGTDDRIHHSHALWSCYGGKWRVREFLGLDQSPAPAREWQAVAGDTADAEVVVLDDANLGFRTTSDLWPRAVTEDGRQPSIVLKMARPVCDGPLWDHLLERHAERLIVVMTVEDLRRTDVQISRHLSWERTAQDAVWELRRNPNVNDVSLARHALISFGTAGAVLLTRGGEPQLFFDPLKMEGEWEAAASGGIIGNTSILTAAVAAEVLRNGGGADMARAIGAGVAAMRRLFEDGCGVPAAQDRVKIEFPVRKIAESIATESTPLAQNRIRDPEQAAAGWWTIMEDRQQQILDVAARIVVDGPERVLQGIPTVQVGKLFTVDRNEIEALRSIRRLFREYVAGTARTPLSIGVFGPPGAGKSFAVKELARADAEAGEPEFRTFNLSQFARSEELYGAFHQVRDIALSGKLPVIFWDEFDALLDGQPLGWLRYFLAPMQDGEFQQGQITHSIGRCIFVFAGGTAHRLQDLGTGLDEEALKNAKVRDFVSRLRGSLSVLGPNRNDSADGDPFLAVRRAILLRSQLARAAPQLFEKPGSGRLNIDDGVLRGFLLTEKYNHGARSMEAIIAMSTLSKKTQFDRSSLPPESQMGLHVDSADFIARVHHITLTEDVVARIAPFAHQALREGKERDGWRYGPEKNEDLKTHPLLVPYEQLDDDAKEANKASVRTIPRKLDAIGYAMTPARGQPQVEFRDEREIETMARLEHELWMQAKLDAGYTLGKPAPDNPRRNEYLVPWDKVPDEMRNADRHMVRNIPRILSQAGFAVVKLRD